MMTVFNPYGAVIKTASGDAVLTGSGIVTIQLQANGVITIGAQLPDNLIVNNTTPWQPPQLSDANAPLGSVYYSTDASALVFKDYANVVNPLY